MNAAALPVLLLAAACHAQPVIVALDMDSAAPGIQAWVDVPVGTTVVNGVAVYVYSPGASRSVLSIGYIGGLDRGIALGQPGTPGQGVITQISGHAGTPVNPGNTGFVFPAMQPGFAGPEVQYVELNAGAPAPIASAPTAPVFTADIHIAGAVPGVRYRVALLDLVTIWRGGSGGAFTPDVASWLTTGGDCVPDQTLSTAGLDADVSQPVPPAAFLVDYIDGIGGGLIRVGGCWANCDESTASPVLNVADFSCFLQRFAAGDPMANCDGSVMPPMLNVADFGCFVTKFAGGCP